jgi:hypothetical protein
MAFRHRLKRNLPIREGCPYFITRIIGAGVVEIAANGG